MQEGDVCRMRLTIPPFKVRLGPYKTSQWRRKWSEMLDKLCNESLILNFKAQLYEDRYHRVRGNWHSFMPDIFCVYADNVHYGYDVTYGYDMLLPEEFVGQLPKGTKLECDFFPEAQRACITWIMCAQQLKVQKDMIQFIGKMILASWNEAEVWYKIIVSQILLHKGFHLSDM